MIEKKLNREASTSNANNNENNSTLPISITLLLRVALLYVASRLFITLATVYLPLYIEETDVGGKQALATVPLTSYLASLIAALSLKYISKSFGTKVNKKLIKNIFLIYFELYMNTFFSFCQ